MAEDRQGTGKHPHKSTEEPYPHTKDNQSQHSGDSNQSHSGHESSKEQSNRSENSDLKEREYRDKEGNVHHHTHTSKEEREK